MKFTKLISLALGLACISAMSVTSFASEDSAPQPFDGSYPQTLIPVEQPTFTPRIGESRFGYSIEVTDTYRGQDNERIVAENEYSPSEGNLSFSRELSWSNTYSCSVGVGIDEISAEVGYDVTYGSSEAATYSVDIPANTKCFIYCKDVLDVTKFDVFQFGKYKGNGWAAEFSNFSLWHEFE